MLESFWMLIIMFGVWDEVAGWELEQINHEFSYKIWGALKFENNYPHIFTSKWVFPRKPTTASLPFSHKAASSSISLIDSPREGWYKQILIVVFLILSSLSRSLVYTQKRSASEESHSNKLKSSMCWLCVAHLYTYRSLRYCNDDDESGNKYTMQL